MQDIAEELVTGEPETTHRQNGAGKAPAVPSVSHPPVTELAQSAIANGRNTFTLPQAGVPTRGDSSALTEPAVLFYDRAGRGTGEGPLPEGCRPILKVGINKWEDIWQLHMQPAQGLESVDGDWWSVELKLSEVWAAR